MTESARRALSILHPDHPLAPELFAHYMWPASKRWRMEKEAVRSIRLEARLLLADLERVGLARRCRAGGDAYEGYVLTRWGEHAMDPPVHPDRPV